MNPTPRPPAPAPGTPAADAGPLRSATDRLAEFLETYGPFDEDAARAEASRCLQCPEALCIAGCPLGNRIPEWLQLTAEGRFQEAAALAGEFNSLPEICAGPCPTEDLCQSACVLSGRGEPVAIGAIARFLTDYALTHPAAQTPATRPNGLSVAILGAGPGALACAEELATRGYAVTVHAVANPPGGPAAHGPLAFQLGPDALARRIEHLRKRGVVFRHDLRPGVDLTLEALRPDHDAIFLACGSQQPRSLEVPGARLEGVIPALTFLLRDPAPAPVPLPSVPVAGQRVVVLGGGDLAMECLQRAGREGAATATGVCRRDAASLRATPREVAAARSLGATFEFNARALAVLDDGTGRVGAVRCERTTPDPAAGPDAAALTGVPGSAFDLPADLVIVALGFEPVPPALAANLARLAHTADGRLRVDENQMTSEPGVFAGGDLVRGPGPIVYAVRDGRRAAAAIHHHLLARRVDDLAASETDHLG